MILGARGPVGSFDGTGGRPGPPAALPWHSPRARRPVTAWRQRSLPGEDVHAPIGRTTGLHQQLEALTAAMRDARIEWALLQPPLGSGPPEDDVVALVRPDHRAVFGSVARAAGLVTVPAARHPLSQLYMGLD